MTTAGAPKPSGDSKGVEALGAVAGLKCVSSLKVPRNIGQSVARLCRVRTLFGSFLLQKRLEPPQLPYILKLDGGAPAAMIATPRKRKITSMS